MIDDTPLDRKIKSFAPLDGFMGFLKPNLVISQTLNIVVRLLLIPARIFFALILIFFRFVCFLFVFPIILVFKHKSISAR